MPYKLKNMKIVVKSIDNEEGDFLVYLKTDDDVSVHAEFATFETLEYVKNELAEGDNTIPVFMDIEKKDLKADFGVNDNLPLVLVFYLDRELMTATEVIGPFVDAVNQSIVDRGANAMAFFLPTDGPERIDCINPLLTTPEQKVRISTLIDEISKSFDIGQGADDEN